VDKKDRRKESKERKNLKMLAKAMNFSSSPNVLCRLGAHSASYSMGSHVSLPGVKRPGREAGQSPPPSLYMTSWREQGHKLSSRFASLIRHLSKKQT
jgi:hypothetical protein